MKLHILILTFAISVFAFDIDVVSCSSVLKSDPAPDDKILYDVLLDIKKNPDDFVCAYEPCDFQHKNGWFAVKKDRTTVFVWNKNETSVVHPTTRHIITDDDGYVMVIDFDKYGIRKVGTFTRAVRDDLITYGYLSGVAQCND